MPRVDLRFRVVQPGGAVRWVHHESELVVDQHGLAVRWIKTYRDETEAYEAAESFKLVFEDNPVPMWLFDPETLKFLAVNDAAVIHYGYDRGSFLKLTLLDIVPQRDRDAIEQAIRNRPGAGGSPNHLWQHFKADGTEIDVLAPHHVLRPARAACGDHGCDGEAPGRGTHRPYGASRCADRFAKPFLFHAWTKPCCACAGIGTRLPALLTNEAITEYGRPSSSILALCYPTEIWPTSCVRGQDRRSDHPAPKGQRTSAKLEISAILRHLLWCARPVGWA